MCKQPGTNDSSNGNDSDQDFDPSADMLVNDFDDEHTLDEEEALEDENADEIDDLQREGEMPLEELLALYRYVPPVEDCKESEKSGVTSTTNMEETSCNASCSSKDQLTQIKTNNKSGITSNPDAEQLSESSSMRSSSKLGHLVDSSNELISDDSDDEEEEEENISVSEWRKTIHIGNDFQACVPSELSINEQEEEFNDQQLWTPGNLTLKMIEDYLKAYANDATELSRSQKRATSLAIPDISLPNGSHLADNEEALFLLLQSDHNVELALRKKSGFDASSLYIGPNQMKPWTEEECTQFEEGLKAHGKDFFIIQRSKLSSRTVNEIVNFYYLWKKTERHDLFVSKFRVEKKKYSLHPGITDYMNQFLLQEQEVLSMQSQPNYLSSSVSGQKGTSFSIMASDSSQQRFFSSINPNDSNDIILSRSNKLNPYVGSSIQNGERIQVGPDSSSSQHSNNNSNSNSVSSSTPGSTSEM